MIRKEIITFILLFFLSFSVLMAEIITLKNGDAIEGVILSMDSKIVRIEDINGTVMEVNRDMISSINYASQNTKINQPLHEIPLSEPTPVTPINPYPALHFEPTPFQSGLLDPELEARRRLVSYNEQSKNPLLATSLSLVFPGTGHFYCHKIASGFFFLGTRTIFAGMTWYGFSKNIDPDTQKTSYNDVIIGSAGAVGFVTMMIIEAIDSYTSATDYNTNLRLKLGIDTLHESSLPIFDSQY